jgi:uncharacterized protein YuzE
MGKREPSISYDQEADAAYVALSESKAARTEEVAEGIQIDYDADGRPVGVEVLYVKSRLGASDLNSYLRGLVEGVLTPKRQAAE